MRAVLSVARRAGPSEPAARSLNSLLGIRSALDVLGDIARLRVVDLTHPLHPGIPYWPGDGYGPFRYAQINFFEHDRKAAGLFEMPEHMGTHIDAPNHFLQNGTSVDCLSVDRLLKPAVTFDIAQRAATNVSTLLDEADIDAGVTELFAARIVATALAQSKKQDHASQQISIRLGQTFLTSAIRPD